jgi:hypothetical protein
MMLKQLHSDVCIWRLQMSGAHATYKSKHYLDGSVVILNIFSP